VDRPGDGGRGDGGSSDGGHSDGGHSDGGHSDGGHSDGGYTVEPSGGWVAGAEEVVEGHNMFYSLFLLPKKMILWNMVR
jgi:hypothetical protein